MTDLTNGRVAKDRKKATLHAIRRYPESQIADYEAALTVCGAKVLGMTIARTLIAPRSMSAHSVTFIVPNPLQRREKLTRCGSERFLTVRPHSNSPAIQDADVRARAAANSIVRLAASGSEGFTPPCAVWVKPPSDAACRLLHGPYAVSNRMRRIS